MVLGMCDPEQDAMHAHVNNVMMTNIRSYFNHGLYKKKAVLLHKAYIYIYIYEINYKSRWLRGTKINPPINLSN